MAAREASVDCTTGDDETFRVAQFRTNNNVGTLQIFGNETELGIY